MVKKKASAKSKAAKAPKPKKLSVATVNKNWLSLSFSQVEKSLISTLNLKAEAAAAIRAVSFATNNPSVAVQVTAAGQSGVVDCTLQLPVGIFPLHYQAVGQGQFAVTVTGAEVSHPIAGTAPKAGTPLIKVS